MKKFLNFYVFTFIIFWNCQNENDLKKDIDSIKKIEYIFECEVDSIGRILDTLSIEKTKLNQNGNMVFNERKKNDAKNRYITKVEYYKDNGNLFYSESSSSEFGILSKSEFLEKDNEIMNAIFYSFDNGKIIDTINIRYQHLYNNKGMKIKTIIDSKVNGADITERHYNDTGNLDFEYFIQSGDTINEITYSYSENTLKNKTIVNYNKGTIVSFDYDRKGFVKYEEAFKEVSDSLIMIYKTSYKTNNQGQIVSRNVTYLPSKIKKYYRYYGNGLSPR